jgi:hypothetical protein
MKTLRKFLAACGAALLLRIGLALVAGATTSMAGKTSLLPDAVWAWAQSMPETRHSGSVPINRNRTPIQFHPHSLPAALVPAGWLRMILGCPSNRAPFKTSRTEREKFPAQ